MGDKTPDNFEVIDEDDIQSPLSISDTSPQKIHLHDLTSIEVFLKKLQRLINEGKSLDNITVTLNRQKRSLDTLILDHGLVSSDALLTNLHDNHRERSPFLCRNFQETSDRRQHVRGKTPYVIFFTPKQRCRNKRK